MHKKQNTN